MNINNMGDAYLSIKEFGELVGMTIHALRLYDKKGIFRPARRGSGTEGKYRYYSPAQITTVKMIRTLTEIGVPLHVIKGLAESRTPEKLIKLLSKNREMVAESLCFLQEVHSVISTFLDLLIEGISITETDISVSVRTQHHGTRAISLAGCRCRHRNAAHLPPPACALLSTH
jgi:DNA-binding transcriptional MerR regulator